MAEQVADLVRNMILVGDLRPGQRVTHDELAARLNVSTMPVREALLRLSYEGLIVGKANRSFHVQLDAERVTMEPPALVAFRHVRKQVGGFEGEQLGDLHYRLQDGIAG